VQAVDHELIGIQSALQTLATSSYLESGDLASFYQQAKETMLFIAASNVVLTDRSGQQVMNTLKPLGEALPQHGALALQQQVVATGKPVISDLFNGPVAKKPVMEVEVPVFVRGEVKYTLAMGIFPERLGDILARQHLAADRVAAIFDSSGKIVARTLNPEEFIGKKGSETMQRAMAESAEGVVAGSTLEGIQVITSYSPSGISGWTVAIGIPAANPLSELRRSLMFTAAMAVLLLVAGLFMARAISLRVIRSIQSLRAPALALGSSAPISVPATEIAEVDELGQALTRASQLIEQRAAERDLAAAAERHMLVAKEAAEQANRTKSEFLAMMSHELRTPLSAVLGFAQLLEGPHYGSLTTKQRQFVRHIVSGGKHLLELINDVLDLSKIEAGRMTVSVERVDIVPLMTSVIATLRATAQKARIDLDAGNFGTGMPAVLADRVRLAQALINLGSNAIKYNRPDGMVTFSYERLAEGKVRIAVADTGVGIPNDQQERIFEPFNRLDADQRAIEGTGIGLALTRRLVELMGGAIGVSSVVEEGSRFWIDMPVYVAAPAEAAAPDDMAIPSVGGSGFSVLYIEDNPSSLALIRNIVATLDDVRFLEATDGSTGVAMAKLYHPDLIILDINLPDLNGYVVMQKLKEEPETAAIPVLALSAGALPSEIKRGVAAGFFRYLTKPIDVARFFEAINAALSRADHEGANRSSTASPNGGSIS
jgi:signal transduction histidine kinase/AmiR/NasT family two-component response regulator